MKLIDKSAVIAEIERKYNQEVQWMKRQGYNEMSTINEYHQGLKDGYSDILSFLDALKVKGVDLDNEIEEVKHNYKVDDNRHTSICSADIEWLANHFFELGLSVNNPITAADKGTAEEIILALNTLGREKMISYDKEIEWLNKIKEL